MKVRSTVGVSLRALALNKMHSILTMLGIIIGVGMVGIFFGYYPAGKAARLDPIEALH